MRTRIPRGSRIWSAGTAAGRPARALEAVRITVGIFPRHRVGLAPENPGVRGAEDSQMELVAEFCRSLRPEQAQVLTQTLDMAQKIMFMEIVNFLRPPT